MVSVKVPPDGPTTARSVSGTEVVGPPVSSNCTEAETSPGWLGSRTCTTSVRLAPGASVNTGVCSVALRLVKFGRGGEEVDRTVEAAALESARNAVQVPATG